LKAVSFSMSSNLMSTPDFNPDLINISKNTSSGKTECSPRLAAELCSTKNVAHLTTTPT
jgi:hypothetical protein